jgi:AmiR/NasT family two-component response regulator
MLVHEETTQQPSVADQLEELDALRRAMTSRAVIEQAKGVVMATQGCDADAAFAWMVHHSQENGQEISEFADELVRSYSTRGAN